MGSVQCSDNLLIEYKGTRRGSSVSSEDDINDASDHAVDVPLHRCTSNDCVAIWLELG